MSLDSSPKTSDSSPFFNNSNYDIIEEEDRSLILSISQLIEEKISKNIKRKIKIKKDCFYSDMINKININDYLLRIVKYTKINISTLILAIVYIDYFCEINGYILTLNNIYRI